MGLKIFQALLIFSRVFVGGLFIVSGLIKANDALGFSYKLEEYFSADALDMPSMLGSEVSLSILICVAEIVLGFAVILGGQIKVATVSLLAMIGFFTWLTYFTASCNDAQAIAMSAGEDFGKLCVTDCGCFGDALRGSVGRSLTPWESFTKDIVLLFFTMIIFIGQFFVKIKLNTFKEHKVILPLSLIVVGFFCWVFGWIFPLWFTIITMLLCLLIQKLDFKRVYTEWAMALAVAVISYVFSFYTLNWLPMKDYRPYAVGKSISEQMVLPADAVREKTVTTLVYRNKQSGEEKEFSLADKEWQDSEKWEWVSTQNTVVQKGDEVIIKDFSVMGYYKQLDDEQKKNKVVDSTIQMDYSPPYSVRYYKLKETATGKLEDVASFDFSNEKYNTLDSTWTFVSQKDSTIDSGGDVPIDLTNWILTKEYVFLLVSKDLATASLKNKEKINEFVKQANNGGKNFVCISPSGAEDIDEFKANTKADYDFYSIDGTEIKIIIRSNPGLVLLQNGVVKAKWPNGSFPTYEEAMKKLSK